MKPLVKIYGTIGAGYLAAHKGILTPESGKAISWMVLYFFMPALIFYNIVSNIKDTDIEMLGVLCLSGAIYYVLGLLYGLAVYFVSPIPRGWLGGLLLCCMINNASDMPIAYVQTIGGSALMPSDSSDLGSAYAVLFSLMFNIITFNLGGTRLVEWDFSRVDPYRSEPTKPALSWGACKDFWRHHVGKSESANEREDESKDQAPVESGDVESEACSSTVATSSVGSGLAQSFFGRTVSRASESVALPENISNTLRNDRRLRRYSTAQSFISSMAGAGGIAIGEEDSDVDLPDLENQTQVGGQDQGQDQGQDSATTTQAPIQLVKSSATKPRMQRFRHSWIKRWKRFERKNYATMYIAHFIHDISAPQMLALIFGITVAMIPWVKRCFSNQQTIGGFRDPPDGLPPLDFLMVFLDFFAGAQIPLGLIMVGATIQQLKIGRLVPGFKRTAIIVALFKLAVLPIIACGWIVALRKLGWIAKDDPLAAVVLAVDAATPSATVQVYVTALHSDPNGEQLELNSFGYCLIVQYIFLPISLTIVVAFVLKHFSA